MNTELLVQHVFTLFILSIIIQFAVNSIFSITMMKDFADNNLGKTIRDVIIIIVAIFICFKVPTLQLFRRVLTLPKYVDEIISGLVLSGMTFLIRNVLDKIKERSMD